MTHETRNILGGRCTIHVGDCIEVMGSMPANSVDCVVTSPPYWGLRDYGVEGQIGLEPTLAQHLDVMVAVFEEVRRILKAFVDAQWLDTFQQRLADYRAHLKAELTDENGATP